MANAGIFSQFVRPAKSMQEYGAEYDRADENKLQLAAKRMQMQQAERGMADQQTARTAYSTSGGDAEKYRNALVNAGLFQEVQALDAAGLKSRETEADITLKGANAKKAGVDADKDKIAIAEKRLNLAGQAFGFVKDNPSAENAQRAVDFLVQNGIWDQAAAQKAIGEIQANPTPEAVKALATQAFQAALAAKDQLPQLFNQNRGGTFAVQAVNPVTMQSTDVSSAPITQSADNAASQATARAGIVSREKEGAANRGVQYAGQRIQRDRLEFDRGASVADVGGPAQSALTKQFGKASAGYRWKADGSQEPIPGGPADQKATTQQAGKETVDSVVSQLRQSYDSLDAGGGITSTDQGALSNLGRRLSQSAVGQFAGGAVGATNQKERDAIAQARPLLLQAIMKATGMSAKQMDSNAELKLYLATATDPTLSLQANREALDRIAELYGGGATPKQPPKPSGAGLSAQEQKELDELRARFGGRK